MFDFFVMFQVLQINRMPVFQGVDLIPQTRISKIKIVGVVI